MKMINKPMMEWTMLDSIKFSLYFLVGFIVLYGIGLIIYCIVEAIKQWRKKKTDELEGEDNSE